MRHAVRSLTLALLACLATTGGISLLMHEDASLGLAAAAGRSLAIEEGHGIVSPAPLPPSDPVAPPPRLARRSSQRPAPVRMPALPEPRPAAVKDEWPTRVPSVGVTASLGTAPGAMARP